MIMFDIIGGVLFICIRNPFFGLTSQILPYKVAQKIKRKPLTELQLLSVTGPLLLKSVERSYTVGINFDNGTSNYFCLTDFAFMDVLRYSSVVIVLTIFVAS